MSDDEETWSSLVLRARYLRRAHCESGSHARRCTDCGRSVWVAPSGLALLNERSNVLVICKLRVHGCGLESVPEDERETIFLPLTPEQLRELRER